MSRALLAAVAACSLAVPHVTVAAADGPPDILGIRAGMPAQEAMKILRAHDPKGHILITQSTLPQLGDKPVPTMITLRGADGGLDIVAVQLTLPPTVQVVWSVSRQLRFAPGKEVVQETLLRALREKYGAESQVNGGRLYWFFSEQGAPVTDLATMRAQNCAESSWNGQLIIDTANEPRTVAEGGSLLLTPHFGRPPCEGLTTVRALLSSGNGAARDTINLMTISVTDGALAGQAKQATDAAIAKADQDPRQQRQQETAPKL